MRHALFLITGMIVFVPTGVRAQDQRKTVTIEVRLPEKAKLFIEGKETRSTGPVRLFVSPPLAAGKYSVC